MKANDIRKGNVIYYEGKPHLVMDFTHRTPGNLRAFVQVRLRNLTTGMSLDHRFSATETVEEARLDTRTMQVLYADGAGVHVMDAQTYEQYTLDADLVGDDAAWMLPEMSFDAVWLEGKPISFTLPASMELEIVETAPAMKTATKNASSKPAVLSNGVTVNVPEFVETGERVRVNPRERAYIERVK
ncbi:MAG: elongation factor P [Gemmatimonadetes bacterium]|nr:elongation factor P [Gemmatimonadota bacterium]MCB9505922.1 elongation factor P [Gemmatimonadales bacterium]MCA9763175.1 elongation factor P [Gemmatimonadota bacterium]MCA9769670.1 elongation factor P [Gemmatimonadota bacterium]MCB9518856.1 elongation factor P [Gemmatimonadales bacterium]